jgi:hypothetical protein
MTVIRDPGVPEVKGEARKDEFRALDKAMTGRRLVVILGVSALALTGVNLAASVYLLGAIGELRAIDKRLEDLAGLEKRLKASLDLVNVGIQAQVERLDGDVHDRVTGLEDGLGQLMQRLDQPVSAQAMPFPETATDMSDAASPPELLPDAAEPPAPAEEAAAAEEPAADLPVAAIEPPKPRKAAKPPASKVGSAYQRIETPDGKVYYRRVR